jgi:hypothetical protein
MKLKNRNQVSLAPKLWKAPNGHRISWLSGHELWGAFVAKVNAYCAQNGFTPPSEAQLEDIICSQLPKRDCVDPNAHWHVPNVQGEALARAGGCRTCGRAS